MAQKKKQANSGENAAKAFEQELEDNAGLRKKVQEHVDSIVEIAKEAGYSFTKHDLNEYLKKKHNPPPNPGDDTCFSEPPGM